MLCSATVLFLTLLTLTGTCLYIVAGWLALDGTLNLFKLYGPVKDRGNPALDAPPQYWVNPNTGKWEPINYNNRGNLVPQVFKGIQYYLISLAVFMVFNSIVFLVDSVRSKKVVIDRHYIGKRTSRTCINCTGWLAGYLVFLTMMWLVMVGFGVLPLVEWRITMQRCWDLDNPNWSPGTTQGICVDLVQYGLVFFKETQDDGYGLICGPGGSYNPPRGDLQGLCSNYYPNFSLYLASFIGACITLIAMVLFAMRHVSNFVYLKVRRWEKPVLIQDPVMATTHEYGQPLASNNYNNSTSNPNYERNILLPEPRLTSNADVDSYGRRSRDDDFEMREKYYDDDDRRSRRNDKRYSRTSSYFADDPVPAFQRRDFGAHEYESSHKHRRRSHDNLARSSRRDYESDQGERKSRRATRHHGTSSESDSSIGRPPRYSSRERDDVSKQTKSTASHKPRALKRKERGAKSDPDVSCRSSRHGDASRRSSRRGSSPPSDYYIEEDMNRHRRRSRREY